MRSPLCGWAVALASSLAAASIVAAGARSTPSSQPLQRYDILNSRPVHTHMSGFVAPRAPRLYSGAQAQIAANRGGKEGGRDLRSVGCGRGCSSVGGKRVREGVTRLEGKKRGGNGMDAEMRIAAKELQQMEAKKKKKQEVKAQRRAGPAQPEKLLKGDVQDDVVSKKSTSAGVNPFKKETVVSKFDVNDIRKVEFIGSYVDDESAWPKTKLPEIAFLGRSNVGKSSMLNTLFGEAVAKVSKTPGRTRQINIFKAKNSKGRDVCYFADLPGYGYAKMGKDIQRTIEKFLELYLERRANLKLLVLLVDSRREPLSADAGVLEYAEDRRDRAFKILVVATKVDKLGPLESTVNIKRLQEAYDLPPGLPVKFSAITAVGKKEIWSYIRQAAAAK